MSEVLNNMDYLDTDTSYMLKLDHLDVNYVSSLNSEFEGVSIPLWSTNGSKSRRCGNDLVEFQVMAGKRDDLSLEPGISDDDINTGYPTYKCVICDADIPILYRKEHSNSAKHKTCLKIVEAVLLRIHSHILLSDEIVSTKIPSNTYFCESCTVVVKNTDKIDHEASNVHQKSVLHDCCLNDFLNIYLDKSFLDSPDMQYLKPNKIIGVNSNITKTQEYGETKSEEPTDCYINKAAYDADHLVGDSYDSSNDENGNTIILPVQQKAKKKRKRAEKKQRLDLKNYPPIEQNSNISKSVTLNLNKDSRSKQNKDTTKEVHDTVKVKNIEEAYKNFPNMFQELNLSSDELDELMKTANESIINQNSSKSDFDKETDSIDEEYHSLDELNNTVKKQTTDTKNNSNDDENSSNKHENDDQNNKEDTTSDQNCAVEQNDKTDKRDNSTVDYIMLVNSNEFDIDTKKYRIKKGILNESDLEKYLKAVNSNQIYFINEDYIRIVTKDGSVVTVRADNFNGFYINDGNLQCRVCMATVNEDATVHIYNVQHMKFVRAPLEDRHCYREINDPFKHCIHCNDTFSNLDIHKNSEPHIKALNESIERSIPAKPVDAKKAAKTYCEPCDLYIDCHNFNSHTNGKLHKHNLSLLFTKDTKKTTENVPSASADKTYCNECKNYVLISTFAKHLNQHANTNKINKDNGKIYCEACHLYIGKNNFPSHVYAKTHQASLVVAKVDTSVGLTMKNFCSTCKIYVENTSSHVTGAYHEFHLDKTNTKKNNAAVSTTSSTVTTESTSNYQMVFTENGAVCRICVVKVPNNPENIKEHTNGRLHKSNYNNLLNNNKIKLSNNKFSCGACNIIIDLTAELDHIQSKSHKLTLSQIDKTHCDLCKVYVLNSNWTSHLSSAKHNAAKETKNNQVITPSTSTDESNNNLSSNQKMCRVCNVKIPTRPDLITEHTNGKAHRTKFSALLDENKLKIVKDRYFCDVCKIAIESTTFFDHIQATTHKNSLAEVLKPQSSKDPQLVLYHCDACDVDMLNTSSTIQEHKETFEHKIAEVIHKSMIKNIPGLVHHHFESSKATDFLKCEICDIDVNATDSTNHSRSPAHISKYETVLRENKIQKIEDNKFLCQICSVEIIDKEELKHIRSPTHLFEKQAVLSSTSRTSANSQSKTGYRCAVCQVDVPNNPKNIAIHDRGSSHVAKLKNLTIDDEEKVLMTKTDSGREMVCSLCKVTVPVSGVSLHVRGAKHRANKISATT